MLLLMGLCMFFFFFFLRVEHYSRATPANFFSRLRVDILMQQTSAPPRPPL